MILLASDHNGVLLKNELTMSLNRRGIGFVDFGPFATQPSVDYTAIASQVAQSFTRSSAERAILICGTGIGMSIVANKFHGIRAAVVHNDLSAVKSREHNDANFLCLGAWIRGDNDNIASALAWLDAPFGGGRHIRRVERIERPRSGRLVFCNGVFDLLHQGHLAMLEWAAGLGERLVVGINSDDSVRRLKGDGRPVNKQADRKAMLQSLRFVDEVIIFDEESPISLIHEMMPDVVVRGGEFTESEVRLRDQIPDLTEIKLFPLVGGYSTTNLIERVRA